MQSSAQLAHSTDLINVSFYHIENGVESRLSAESHIPECTLTTVPEDCWHTDGFKGTGSQI